MLHYFVQLFKLDEYFNVMELQVADAYSYSSPTSLFYKARKHKPWVSCLCLRVVIS
jgi:hypothetical protein